MNEGGKQMNSIRRGTNGGMSSPLNRHRQAPHFAPQPSSARERPIVPCVIGGRPQRRLRNKRRDAWISSVFTYRSDKVAYTKLLAATILKWNLPVVQR